ncbi:MAG: hypothetical protein WDA18_03045 [Candidatus Ratteibacteria bacterium]|jgi:hypothetical protein
MSLKTKVFWVFSLLLLSGWLFGALLYSEESRIDPVLSTFRFSSTSAEDIRGVFGETLAGWITFKDADGNPLAGIDGKNVQLISTEEGGMILKTLSGKSSAKGILHATFSPKNPKSEEIIKLAIRAEGVVLEKVVEVKFHPAAELVDQCQPLWTGPYQLYGQRTIGQTFVTGNIDMISKITVSTAPKGDAPPMVPVLNLYLWDTDYQTTISKAPVAASTTPEMCNSPYWKRLLATYKINASVKKNTKYYFELHIPDKSGDAENYFYVWRTWGEPDFYPAGTGYCLGREEPKINLRFFVFYPAQ